MIGPKHVKKGTWLLAARVVDDVLWNAIKEGKLTGWSMEGTALAEHLI
jgi:DNA adenine methylase